MWSNCIISSRYSSKPCDILMRKGSKQTPRLPLVNPLPLVFLIKNSFPPRFFPPRSYFSSLPPPSFFPQHRTRHNINPGTRTKRLIEQFTRVHPDTVALITFNYARRINSHSHQRGRPWASKRSEFSFVKLFSRTMWMKRINKFFQFGCFSLYIYIICNSIIIEFYREIFSYRSFLIVLWNCIMKKGTVSFNGLWILYRIGENNVSWWKSNEGKILLFLFSTCKKEKPRIVTGLNSKRVSC